MPHQCALCYDMKKVYCQAGIKVGEMLSSHKDNIILVGMMGTGKSTVGAHLADKLGYRLIDLDQQIVVITSYSIHYTKLYELAVLCASHPLPAKLSSEY